ncbi:pimeloyl-ACP methyl ester carboxylesterase [Nitrobacteraceae bacterium AZCC 2161]
MATIMVKDGTEIHYKDWGAGQPLAFSHAFPISSDSWDSQMIYFGERGYRAIAYDRRCHGRSISGCSA